MTENAKDGLSELNKLIAEGTPEKFDILDHLDDDLIKSKPARKEDRFSGKTFTELMESPVESDLTTRERSALWRQQLRDLCDPRIIKQLMESPIPKDRMEAFKFCAQYGYGMPDKIIAAAILIKDQSSISLSDEVLRAALSTLSSVVAEKVIDAGVDDD